MTTPLAHYEFTTEDVLRALDSRMRAMDHARGITFFPPGKGPGPRLAHLVRFDGNTLTVDVLAEASNIVSMKSPPSRTR